MGHLSFHATPGCGKIPGGYAGLRNLSESPLPRGSGRHRRCLRRGRSDSGMDRAPFVSAYRIVVSERRGLPSPTIFAPGRAEQPRPRAWVQPRAALMNAELQRQADQGQRMLIAVDRVPRSPCQG